MAPDKITVPAPVLVKAPVPLITPDNVTLPDAVAVFSVSVPPFVLIAPAPPIVPPAIKVTGKTLEPDAVMELLRTILLLALRVREAFAAPLTTVIGELIVIIPFAEPVPKVSIVTAEPPTNAVVNESAFTEDMPVTLFGGRVVPAPL